MHALASLQVHVLQPTIDVHLLYNVIIITGTGRYTGRPGGARRARGDSGPAGGASVCR